MSDEYKVIVTVNFPESPRPEYYNNSRNQYHLVNEADEALEDALQDLECHYQGSGDTVEVQCSGIARLASGPPSNYRIQDEGRRLHSDIVSLVRGLSTVKPNVKTCFINVEQCDFNFEEP